MDKLLEIKNLAVNFYLDGQVIRAVERVNFYIGEKEILVLAGESGSGKTVTALSITAILPPSAKIVSGEANFSGKDLLTLSKNELTRIRGKEIAYIFQEPASYLNPVYTIGEQIIETIMLHQDKDRRQACWEAHLLLGLVKIPEPQRVLASYPHQLSGGMNQRAFIAMAWPAAPGC